jgi:hypothetical protein
MPKWSGSRIDPQSAGMSEARKLDGRVSLHETNMPALRESYGDSLRLGMAHLSGKDKVSRLTNSIGQRTTSERPQGRRDNTQDDQISDPTTRSSHPAGIEWHRAVLFSLKGGDAEGFQYSAVGR